MAVFTVETTVDDAGDGLLSFSEAFAAAERSSLRSGEEATIRFDHAMNIVVTETIALRSGAQVAIDGRIAGDTSTEVGINDVTFSGNGGAGYQPGAAFGGALMHVAAGAALRLVDVTLRSNLAAGGNGGDGLSGDDGLDGADGEGEGLPGAPGNGGLTVTRPGTDGQMAVGGILNDGTLTLDRVNLNGLNGFGGNGGAAGDGGQGGDGGNGGGGQGATGGPGGPAGSGLGTGGDGGIAAGAILNRGTLTLRDTWFQANGVSAGIGGDGGSGGDGGNGGFGTFGGFGGDGGQAGRGGDGANGAATVLNLGQMTVEGGWADGNNTVFAGSGAAGSGGQGGTGGTGGGGDSEDNDGEDGISPLDGVAGTAGTSAEVLGHGGGFAGGTFFVEANFDSLAEFGGAGSPQAVQITVIRLGSTAGSATVALSLAALGGASGNSIQGGEFSNRLLTFDAGESAASLVFFVQADGVQGADAIYRFGISNPTGAVLGGNDTADLVIRNADLVGDAAANALTGTARADLIAGGLGNDTIDGRAGDDRIDGQGGIDTASYADAQRGPFNAGAVVDLLAFTATARGLGRDQIFNVENITGSAFNDRMTGDFNANVLTGAAGNDRLSGGFNHDTLLGGGGADMLAGGDGDDRLDGGLLRDRLTGGAGADTFVFGAGTAGNMAASRDVITDFGGADGIALLRSGAGPFDALDFGRLESGAFRLGAAARDVSDRILYDSATGLLRYDADGRGGVAAEVFAQVDPGTLLTAGDFQVI